ncbi:hypothetical protein [Haloferax sp. DFSO60]|uniref:hypothetical protein n=1 Tax=Haloferax sp. DFSO60 TaxID=3388652 RepID=UPI0039793FC4
MALQRVCYDCGTRTTDLVARCECGEPLWLDTDSSSFDWDAVISVTNDEIRRAQRVLATDAGLSVEAASTAALAGTKQLVADGVLEESDDVAVVATGTGLKDASADAMPTHVTLTDVQQSLAEFVSKHSYPL